MHEGADRVKEAKVQTLKVEFELLCMKEIESIDDFAIRLTTIVNNIRALGEKMEESYAVKKFLRAVHKKFLHIASAIEQFGDLNTMTVEEVIGRLKAHEERLGVSGDDTEEHVLLTHVEWKAKEANSHRRFKKFDKIKVRCYNGQNLGHFASECHSKKEEKAYIAEKQEDGELALLMGEACLL